VHDARQISFDKSRVPARDSDFGRKRVG
jgi:hypothetical protein